MKRFLLLLPFLCLMPAAAHEKLDAHDLCLAAADYSGCIEYNTPKEIGNACKPGYAYVGDGACREVTCRLQENNHPLIAGKMWNCRMWYLSKMRMSLGAQIEAHTDSNCPAGEPEIGWNSTCNAPYEEPPKEERVDGIRY